MSSIPFFPLATQLLHFGMQGLITLSKSLFLILQSRDFFTCLLGVFPLRFHSSFNALTSSSRSLSLS
ncbi:hypothetical protein JB92DRAFT_2924008 [Gautieria morchelliformis]|nr:hypothetical protein JB92DRAFT_2924008 [Gautieria morchelliformis]